MADATKTHWIIVSDEGTSSKPRKHDTYDSAYNESVRLSKLNPGINFTVFKSIVNAFTAKPIEQDTKITVLESTSVQYWYSYPYNNRDFHL